MLSDPDSSWVTSVTDYFTKKNLPTVASLNGKDCQLKMYKGDFNGVVLDLDTRDHSALEVLKYLRLNHPEIKVVITVKSKKLLEELGLDMTSLKKMGMSDVLIKPLLPEKVFKCFEADNQLSAWKDIPVLENQDDEAQSSLTAKDEEFTRIKLETFYSGNSTIFDHFIRLSANKYVKILNRGERFHPQRLAKYLEKKVEYLYFKTSDRGMYINFMNEMLKKEISLNKTTIEKKLQSSKNVIEKYIEEVYLKGLKPSMVEEGMKICENMYDLVQRDKSIADILRSYEDYDPPAYCHLFLTSFLGVMICKNIDWSTKRTTEIVAMAALLHDIGKLRLPLELRDKRPKEMSPKQFEEYKKHPVYGTEMLSQSSLVSDPIIQIIYQHHEQCDGEGFPNKLGASKIYPLAKIVSLADFYSHILISKKITPLEGLKVLLADKESLKLFDPQALKSLAVGFLKET